jgi:chromate transporter
MGKKSLKDLKQYFICIISAILLILFSGYFTTLIIIVISGFAGYVIYKNEIINTFQGAEKRRSNTSLRDILRFTAPVAFLALIFIFFAVTNAISFTGNFKLINIFSTFGTMGVTLIGGGYVLIPMIHDIIVTKLMWLTPKEFTDSIALGQITPGPIMISATFIGYKLMYFRGALAATVGMFCVPGILMIICSKYYLIINKSQFIKVALKGIRAAVIGMIISAVFFIVKSSEINLSGIIIFILVFLLSYFKKIDAIILILFSGLAGFLFG